MQEEEKSIPLIKPIEFNGQTYAEMPLREPTAAELSKATRYGGDNNVDVAISLISQIAEVPMKVAGMLGQRDFQACNDFLGSFTATGQEIGEMSSPS